MKKIAIILLFYLPVSLFANEICKSLYSAKKYNEAFKQCSKDASQGDNYAKKALTTMYAKGKGTEVNLHKSFELDLDLAKRGDKVGIQNISL